MCTAAPDERALPATYVREHVELAYATTVHGAQGETVPTAHLLVGETTGAAAAYVGMTRGRNRNTAHLVADTLDEARSHWIEVFSRDRADLGPGHAADGRRGSHRALRTQGSGLRDCAPSRGAPGGRARPLEASRERPPVRRHAAAVARHRPLIEVHFVGHM